MKNIVLVTGGAGFIGSHLCEYLLRNGNKVICLDNMFTGTYQNIKTLLKNNNFEYVKANVIEPMNFVVNQIYNLACPASPIHYQYDPIMTTRTNFLGAINVLDLAQKNKASVLQANTSEM
jgi:UDP-glucuronate decarboxylase